MPDAQEYIVVSHFERGEADVEPCSYEGEAHEYAAELEQQGVECAVYERIAYRPGPINRRMEPRDEAQGSEEKRPRLEGAEAEEEREHIPN